MNAMKMFYFQFSLIKKKLVIWFALAESTNFLSKHHGKWGQVSLWLCAFCGKLNLKIKFKIIMIPREGVCILNSKRGSCPPWQTSIFLNLDNDVLHEQHKVLIYSSQFHSLLQLEFGCFSSACFYHCYLSLIFLPPESKCEE